MSPQRIQRKRTKGWRMPEGAIYVGRPTKWGNPWRVVYKNGAWMIRGNGETSYSADDTQPWTKADAAGYAVERFRSLLTSPYTGKLGASSVYGHLAQLTLGGHDLACWCPLDQPCHADVLLELANGCLSQLK